MIGECEQAWKLREAIAFAAQTTRHVLVLGERGVGKELAARAVHGLSARRDKSMMRSKLSRRMVGSSVMASP